KARPEFGRFRVVEPFLEDVEMLVLGTIRRWRRLGRSEVDDDETRDAALAAEVVEIGADRLHDLSRGHRRRVALRSALERFDRLPPTGRNARPDVATGARQFLPQGLDPERLDGAVAPGDLRRALPVGRRTNLVSAESERTNRRELEWLERRGFRREADLGSDPGGHRLGTDDHGRCDGPERSDQPDPDRVLGHVLPARQSFRTSTSNV